MLIELLILAPVVLGADGCGDRDYYLGACSYSGAFDDDGAALDGRGSIPGSGIDIDGGDGDTDGSEPRCDAVWLDDCLFWISDPPESGSVTMADVARFAPSVGSHGMEPNGWAVIGLSTNFVSSAEPRTVSGEVLGSPAEVRFTPVAWHWDYGDGQSRSSRSPGGTWEALRVPEFEDTATSHRFRERGTFIVSLTVVFEADYRVGGGAWTSIPGTLPLEADPLRVLARTARTVLVDEDCIQNPHGPGC